MLYYCGFDTFLQFKQKSGKNNIYLQPLSDLVLDRNDKVINAFLGWCSLFLQTGSGQVLYLGYSKSLTNKTVNVENDMVVCSQVPKYIVNIECGAKETFLITLDPALYKWSGFDFAKTFPLHISLEPCQPNKDSTEKSSSELSTNKEDDADDSLSKNSTSESPIQIEQLCVGVEFSCVLTKEGKAHLFDVITGQLGELLTELSIEAVSAGQEHILLLTTDGQVWSYGRGTRGQLGHGDITNIIDGQAKIVEALEGIPCKAISAGGWHSLALSEEGDVYVWGWNESGQLGMTRDSTNLKATPFPLEISDDDRFMAISAGSRHSMALSENGILFGWGWNKWGQLGLDPKTNIYCDTPQVIPVDEKVCNINCKYWSSLIETDDSGD